MNFPIISQGEKKCLIKYGKFNCEIYFLWHRFFWVTLYFPHVYFPHMWFFRRVMRTGSNCQQPMYWAPDILSVSSSFFRSYHCHLYEIHLTYLYFLAYLLPLYREHFHKNWVILQKKFQDEKDKLKWMEYSLTGSIKKFHPIIFSV